ncbi:hypothetical protein, partial [Streptomyces scabiei]|uniref:hypothetical protein n=1 Tax=Streptomyces scabiei TaxID=1930 RepID=UPI0029C02C49
MRALALEIGCLRVGEYAVEFLLRLADAESSVSAVQLTVCETVVEVGELLRCLATSLREVFLRLLRVSLGVKEGSLRALDVLRSLATLVRGALRCLSDGAFRVLDLPVGLCDGARG